MVCDHCCPCGRMWVASVEGSVGVYLSVSSFDAVLVVVVV